MSSRIELKKSTWRDAQIFPQQFNLNLAQYSKTPACPSSMEYLEREE
jgi:hypothetical protein